MTNSPDPTNDINQDITENKGQVFGQMMGGIAVGQLTVYLSQKPTEETTQTTTPDDIGENPYQGLKAFRETDGDRFFGRDSQIQKLWEEFQKLHGDRSTIRVLPIYGPSGSGKSSLARAGLIPALGKKPLAGQEKARVVSLKPNNCPLEALAIVLARIVTKDDTPVAKTKEFETALLTPNDKQEFDGLRRIANVLPDINFSPLIILVDQFEELYTLCEDESVRHAFVENLLCAASDPSQQVSVIITMRSDFLGKTQQHPRLNALFSSQGHLVPIMQPEEFEVAITEPAKQAGYELDKAVVELLIKESQGQDGALPLLQFALTQIWEELRNGIQPIETFKKIGGVGGALANEAKRIYYDLTPEQQIIARCIFLALIQLNDDNKSTRRRAAISELIGSQQNETLVREVIDRFARPGVWILVTFCSDQQVEMLEVAHEALIQNWQELKDWLKEYREALSKKRKIEQFTDEWKTNKKSKDYLLQGRILRDAREFLQAQKDNTEISLSELAIVFLKASTKKQRVNTLKLFSILLVFPFIGTLIAVHLQIISKANLILSKDDCKPDVEIGRLLKYMWWTKNADRLSHLNLCQEDLRGLKIPRVIMPNSNLNDANLSNSDLSGATLADSNFRGVEAAYADFSNNTFLMGADFGCSVNRCAFILHSNFQNAKLINADFHGASLIENDFKKADLTGTKFNNVEGLTTSQLEGAILCRTIIPDYLKNSISGDRNCPQN